MAVLSMLDLSVGFEIIDHPLLLKQLKRSFGIKETILTWIKLYLTPPDVRLQLGVPQ